jgi:hypothetical protein
MQSGADPRFRDLLSSANRLDRKDEMRVSVELILDAAAPRIAAAA